MSVELPVVEQTTNGESLRRVTLTLASHRVTAKEILQMHVRQELNNHRTTQSSSIIIPKHPVETELNSPPVVRIPDMEKCISDACDAFDRNSFIMFVDSKQISELSDTVFLSDTSSVTFMRLIPLAAG